MFAQKTKVPSDKSIGEIRKALDAFGAKKFSLGTRKRHSFLKFTYNKTQVKFYFDTPEKPGKDATIAQRKKYEQALNTRWRQVLLCVKAKLQSVECGLETFEEAFMAHIQLPRKRKKVA